MKREWKGVLPWLLILVVAPVAAQEQGSVETVRTLEEVIVTATKRAVPLQQLPMSVGVLTDQELEDIDAFSLEDYWRQIPSLAVRDAPFGGNSVIIRGLSDTDSFNSTESLSAFYLDDTAITYVSGLFATPANPALVDVERVEVLRGPQGSLVGANAMGGAIRIITREPDLEGPTTEAEVRLGNTAHGSWSYGGQLVLNQPTGDASGVRLAAYYQFDDGFIDDVGTQRRNINNEERAGARASWLWEVSESFDVLLRAYVEDIDSDGYNYTDPVGKPQIGLPTSGDYEVALLSAEPREEQLRQASVRLRWRAEWGEFYSATSWYEKDLQQDYDWSPELFYDFFGVWNPAPFAADSTQRDLSQEFRLNSTGDGRLNWLAGFYYLDQELDRQDTGTVPGLLQVCPPCDFLVPPDEVILNLTERRQREDAALFGEVSWRFTDRLEATVGGRWYRIDQSLESTGFFSFFPVDDSVSGDSDNFVPKASLSWDVNADTMVYGLISQGFRPGQFNGAAARDVCGARAVIDSDDLTNYELGLKSLFADGRFSLNATVFHIDWNDVQTNLFLPDCGFVYLENAGKATSDGVEVDFKWALAERFLLQGGFGYNKAELAEALPNPDVDAPAGTRMPNTPEWTANLAGTWQFKWSGLIDGYLRADGQYVGSRTTIFDQSPPFDIPAKLDAYTLVNVRVGAENDRWRSEFYVTNLFDELADVFCCRLYTETTITRPRTMGVRAIFTFD